MALNTKRTSFKERSVVKVSVVIPCYNSERYISQTIDSVVSQTISPLEVILVDDQSQDGTLDLLRRKEKQYKGLVKITELQKNQGASYARNYGAKQALGDYILFMDADDLAEPKLIEKYCSRLEEINTEEKGQYKLCYSAYIQIDENDCVISEISREMCIRDRVVLWGTGQAYRKFREKNNIDFEFFIDSDKSKHGKELDGKHIYPPQILLEIDKNNYYVLILSQFFKEIYGQLESYKYDYIEKDVYKRQGNYGLGIITDGDSQVQRNKICALGIEKYFTKIIVTDDCGIECRKPSAEPYKEMIRHFGGRPDEFVYIGDNPHKDFVTAKKLGIYTVRIRREIGEHMKTILEKEYEADFTIFSLTEVERILKSLEEQK